MTRCSACNLAVDAAATRCPKCLRQSTLAADGTGYAPASRRLHPAIAVPAVVGLIAMRIALTIDTPLTAWMNVADLALALFGVGAWGLLIRAVRKEGVETVSATNRLALVLMGLFMGAIAVAMLAFAVVNINDPLALTEFRRTRIHQWALAHTALAVAGLCGWLSSVLWRKLARL